MAHPRQDVADQGAATCFLFGVTSIDTGMATADRAWAVVEMRAARERVNADTRFSGRSLASCGHVCGLARWPLRFR